MERNYISRWLTALILVTSILYSHQACTQFVEIAEEDYTRTYIPIGDADETSRPLGFLKSTVVYQGSDDNPCFTVTGGESGQNIELKFETIPSMQLCVKETETGEILCDNGHHSSCRTFTQQTMSYELFCETSRGCAEGDVNFWLRLTKGPKPADDTEGKWCYTDLKNKFPESLRPLPPNFTPKPTEPTIGGASVHGLSFEAFVLAAILSIYL